MRALAASMVVMVWIAGIAGTAGCETSGRDGVPAPDGGTGAAVDGSIPLNDSGQPANGDASGTVSGDSSVKATACTAAPFVGYSATITKLAANGTSAPLAGAQIGFSTCEGFELTTSATGQASTQLTQGIATTPLFNSSVAIGAIGAEIPANGAVTTAVTLFDDDVTTLIPGFSRDGGEAAIVEVVLAADAAATAPCNATTGVTLSVTGHSEAAVSYMGASWPTDTTVASTTASAAGTRAFIGGITGTSKVQITGAKSGCSVKLVTASQTGLFLLLPGSITIGTATVTN